jgi:UDP-N-acetylmuramoyl-L-alanyl-D-glutamate--2,6-diaminopimelate ligase
VVTVSPSGDTAADWRVTARETAASPVTFTLVHRDGHAVRPASPLAGHFNVDNAAMAAVACLAVGVPPDRVVRGLAEASVPGRMERVSPAGGGRPLAVVDYAHTPEAVATVLAALRPAGVGRLVAVLGAGGERDREKRPMMGAAAARHADLVVVTDDNPRSEDPAAIRAAVLGGARAQARDSGAQVIEVADRRAALCRAVRGLGEGDVIAVLGKGHEQGQEIAGTVHAFDDRTVLREALDGRTADRGEGAVR